MLIDAYGVNIMNKREKRYAVIDFGTNSIRMLVADFWGEGQVKPVYQDLRITRLGRGVSKNKKILPEAINDTLTVVRDFVLKAHGLGAEQIYAVATSAVRDAENREEFRKRVYEQTGLKLNIISGEKEAELTYLGVQSILEQAMEVLVVDIGGGSTEFIWKTPSGDIKYVSLDLGAVRMTEDFLVAEQPAEEQFVIMQERIRTLLERGILDLMEDFSPRVILGVGGTITTLAAIDQRLEVYRPEKVHGYRLSFQKIQEILALLKATPLQQRKMIPGLQPGRADIIVAGTAILSEIMSLMQVNQLIVSEYDLLHGSILYFSSKTDKLN